MHADCESALLDDRSEQDDLWGANRYLQEQRIEFESRIDTPWLQERLVQQAGTTSPPVSSKDKLLLVATNQSRGSLIAVLEEIQSLGEGALPLNHLHFVMHFDPAARRFDLTAP